MPPTSTSFKLKDPRICRVFVSSPFGGYEKEREELVLKHFPQLQHMCQGRGVQFVAVDMRWGITTEAASDAQVVSICLREIDRSDIFVGFYGQRYGWHGAKDEMLQKNIENALKKYSWLGKVKDRSVTEFEFLHGHLNSPGKHPSIIAFRSKAYDEQKVKEAEKSKNTKEASKYKVESPEAAKLVTALRDKVAKTKDKCVALQNDYKTPEEGAKFVFEQLKETIEKMVSTKSSESKRDLDLANHDVYRVARDAIFVGGVENLKKIDIAVSKGQKILISGSGGAGKAALMSRWLTTQVKNSKLRLIYHFVGCATDSAVVPDIVRRLTDELQHISGEKSKSRSEQLQEMSDEFDTAVDLQEQCRQLEVLLNKVAAKTKTMIVIAIDGLGKVAKQSKTAKPLFWLPPIVPSNVVIIGTCRDTDSDTVGELKARGFVTINVDALNRTNRNEMCKELFKRHSKELSTAQMNKIVEEPSTGNPLFLKICIMELCNFGKFRELDEKITELIDCKNVKELFQKFIRRLESDYITDVKKGNIVEQVLCSIWVSRDGLSEGELMSMHGITSHEWSPLFFAMQDYVTEMGGLIRFGFEELRQAVESRWLTEKNTKLKYQKIVANYFDDVRKNAKTALKLDDPTLTRPALELPWLLLQIGEKDKLVQVLTDLAIFSRLFLDHEYELVELWRSTGLTGTDIAKFYLKAIEAKAKDFGAQVKDASKLQTAIFMTLIPYLGALSYFLEMGHYQGAQEMVLDAQLRIMDEFDGVKKEDTPSLNNLTKKRNMSLVQLKLAYLYADTGRYAEADALHKQVLAIRDEVLKAAENKKDKDAGLAGLAQSYHGIAMLQSKMNNTEQAITFYKKSIEVQKELGNHADVADSLHNLGVMLMKQNKYDQALDACTKSLKIYEDIYFANLPPVIGVMMGNIAVCHRNLGNNDEAEKNYKKAIEISERALGRLHPNVAVALMNLGTLEVNRGNLAEAEVSLSECKSILEATQGDERGNDYDRCVEKLVYVLIKMNHQDKALPLFKQMYNRAKSTNSMNSVWPNVYVVMLDWFIQKKMELAYALEITVALLNSPVAHEKNYMQYEALCTALGKKPDPKYNSEKALKGKPKSLGFIKDVIEKKLIPVDDLGGIKKLLVDADSDWKMGPDLYGTAVMWCREAKKEDLAFGVLEFALEKFPDELPFTLSIAQKLYEKEEFEKCKPLCEKIIKKEPDNPNHYMMLGDICLRTNDFTRAKQLFLTMNTKFSDNERINSQVQGALNMIKQMEQQGKK